MQTQNIIQSMRNWFEHLLDRRNKLAPRANSSQKSKNEGNGYAYRPAQDEIVVVEIEQVEFVQEWSRTVASEAVTHAKKNTDAVSGIDRRLPNFERRRPEHDRRSGEHHDRRAGAHSGTHFSRTSNA
jgi:predicted ribonuclease toxin of YeeF-YezG toxin-antitoxin module